MLTEAQVAALERKRDDEEEAGGEIETAHPGYLGRGREPGYPGPPAQIRTCALTHTAPTLGG